MSKDRTGKPLKIGKYDISGRRSIALRVYVNDGEQQLIEDAIRKNHRIPATSKWVADQALRQACAIMNLDYPYPDSDR